MTGIDDLSANFDFNQRLSAVAAETGATQAQVALAWIMAHGPIPPGMNVLHRCDTRLCVRADHLFLGTQAENMTDMARKGRATTSAAPPGGNGLISVIAREG